MAAPHYVAGIDFAPEVRGDAYNVMARLVEHYRNNTTDQADTLWHEPVRAYRDPDLWQREVEAVHRTVPLPLAMSCELPGPGSYKSIDVAGTPVLITRDSAGEMHAMLNVCRHRGAELLAEGTGSTNRITCPYHSWTYDLKGCLLGVYGEKTFGGVDKDQMGLRTLPVVERAGLVFVSLDRDATIDLDAWLGPELLTLLEAMALDKTHHYSTRTLEGPNWKVVIDGYFEGYHFASLHRTTVFRTNLSNMAAFDKWGAHQRNSSAWPSPAVGVRRSSSRSSCCPAAPGARRTRSRSSPCARNRLTTMPARPSSTPATGSTTSSWTRTTPPATASSAGSMPSRARNSPSAATSRASSTSTGRSTTWSLRRPRSSRSAG